MYSPIKPHEVKTYSVSYRRHQFYLVQVFSDYIYLFKILVLKMNFFNYAILTNYPQYENKALGIMRVYIHTPKYIKAIKAALLHIGLTTMQIPPLYKNSHDVQWVAGPFNIH